jgi:hypothetical protein
MATKKPAKKSKKSHSLKPTSKKVKSTAATAPAPTPAAPPAPSPLPAPVVAAVAEAALAGATPAEAVAAGAEALAALPLPAPTPPAGPPTKRLGHRARGQLIGGTPEGQPGIGVELLPPGVSAQDPADAPVKPAPLPPGSGPARYFPETYPGAAPVKPAPVVTGPPAAPPPPTAAVKPLPAVKGAPKPGATPPAKKVKPAVTDALAVGAWGKVGTQAEAYKRLLMTTTGLTDEQIHATVTKELGAKAGPLSYVKWYRAWLLKHGEHPGSGVVKA